MPATAIDQVALRTSRLARRRVEMSETITELRHATIASFVAAVEQLAAVQRQWVGEIRDLIAETVGLNVTIGLERVNPGAAIELAGLGVRLVDPQEAVEQARDDASSGDDGVIEPGMTLCIESFIGGPDAREGVKLEQQVLIPETGTELMSLHSFDEGLLG